MVVRIQQYEEFFVQPAYLLIFQNVKREEAYIIFHVAADLDKVYRTDELVGVWNIEVNDYFKPHVTIRLKVTTYPLKKVDLMYQVGELFKKYKEPHVEVSAEPQGNPA